MPTPATVEDVLNGVERHTGDVPYTEEIYHPALPRPKTNRGTLRADPDGTLIRTQEWPTRKTSKVGRRFVTIIDDDGQANLLPIPEEFALWLSALRALATGSPLPSTAQSQLVDGGRPWKVSMRTHDGTPEIFIMGCGKRLLSFETTQSDRVRRVIRFDTP